MKVHKTIGAGVASLGLVVGLSGAAGATTGVIDYTGPDSYNKIDASMWHRVHLNNNNNLQASNSNGQSAFSGSAAAVDNTTAGGARTGDAVNSNSTRVSATINNSASNAAMQSNGNWGGSDSARISTTGPDSYNKIELKKSSKVTVNNNNNLQVNNTNSQFAKSGSAHVSHNTTGGSATTGDARNTNTTVTELRVTN